MVICVVWVGGLELVVGCCGVLDLLVVEVVGFHD
jgi:hypothetical protein